MARDIGGGPTDVTADTLVAWFGAQTGWKTETRRNYRAAVRSFWRWAYRTKRVPDHLADELPKVRERHGAPRPAPDHAWQSALTVADARTTLMLRLAGEAGMRRGEVSQVHTRDLLESGGAPSSSCTARAPRNASCRSATHWQRRSAVALLDTRRVTMIVTGGCFPTGPAVI
jgi:hypothetical protein